MKEIQGNVWDFLDENSGVCILTNNTVVGPGHNIMGAGIAKEAVDRNPGLELICGKCIKEKNFILGVDKESGALMVRFPTKEHVWKNSELEVIADSLLHLTAIARLYSDKIFYLPRPGCGCGGLDWEEDVKPLCEIYLKNIDNVYIVSFKGE